MNPTRCAAVLATLFLAACSLSQPSSSSPSPSDDRSTETATVTVETARSGLERNRAPNLTGEELDAFTRGQGTFATDLLRSIVKEGDGGNAFLSPSSISTALAMTYAGARSSTAASMKSTLHFELPDDRIHTGFNQLDLELGRHRDGAAGVRLSIVNSIWGQHDLRFESPFLDTLAVDYGTGLNLLDFRADGAEPARRTINAWVGEKTEQRIKEILPPASVDADTKLVLVNAINFKASWATKFEVGATTSQSFTTLSGATQPVRMMHGLAMRAFGRGEDYEAIELPYQGDALSMLVILPAAGKFEAVESKLEGSKLFTLLDGLKPESVDLALPKLKIAPARSIGLKTHLSRLGMGVAFAPDSADFSGISPDAKALWMRISDVYHSAFLELDESGAEATAATAVVVGSSSGGSGLPPNVVQMNVDRPFITAIVDRRTKTILFLGRIVRPTS